jgi:hypothetical protein
MPVKSPVISTYLQSAAGLGDNKKPGSPVVQARSTVLDQKSIQTNNTLVKRLPFVSSIFWIGLFQGE